MILTINTLLNTPTAHVVKFQWLQKLAELLRYYLVSPQNQHVLNGELVSENSRFDLQHLEDGEKRQKIYAMNKTFVESLLLLWCQTDQNGKKFSETSFLKSTLYGSLHNVYQQTNSSTESIQF